MKTRGSYDYYLILATCVVLAIISVICVYGMFAFKFAQIQQTAPDVKAAYMNGMNLLVSPFIIGLILLLCICVPKRLLPVRWLNIFTAALLTATVLVGVVWGLLTALKISLGVTLILQLIVLVMAVCGSEHLNFEKKGYWQRVGSSALHLGLVLFIFDLFFHQNRTLHLFLFWLTTTTTVAGMVGCFYAEAIGHFAARILTGQSSSGRQKSNGKAE